MKAKEVKESMFYGNETLLLADDEARIREVAKRTLTLHGYKVLTAKDGKEAVKIYKAQKKRIELVIMDVVMPKMNGYNACVKIKKYDPSANILISSGYIESKEAQLALKAGGDKFVEKPFHLQELLYAVRANLDAAKTKNEKAKL